MVILGMILMASIQVTRFYHRSQMQRIEQQVSRAQTELKLLKTQISPHFLFNTLNNIYGLAYMGDPRAANMISKLAQIMRYLLDDCEQPRVPLDKERDLVNQYLALQQLRFEGNKNIDFYHAGVQHSHSIVPMVLINFVENCFKHSDLDTNPDAWIKITMEVEDNVLHFRSQNTIRKVRVERERNQPGIGLTNSIKLLESNYPGNFNLQTEVTDHVFQLEVTINMNV